MIKKTNLKIVIILISFFILFSLTSAKIEIQIEVPDSFGSGEQIYFNYSLVSDIDTEIIVVPHIQCYSVPVALIVEETINLKKDSPHKEVYYDLFVEDFFEPQICKASISVVSPIEFIEEKEFQIVTNPSFLFSVELDKKIFVNGENIYLDYSSDIESPEVSAILTYPDKTTEQITLPTSMKAGQIGTYEIEVTASKEGYKTMTKKEQFGVIGSSAEVTSSFERIGQESRKSGSSEKSDIRWGLMLGVLLGFVIMFLVVIFLIYKIFHSGQRPYRQLSRQVIKNKR